MKFTLPVGPPQMITKNVRVSPTVDGYIAAVWFYENGDKEVIAGKIKANESSC